MTKNFEITAKENGKKYWISRSVAVCAIVVVFISATTALLQFAMVATINM